MYKDRSGSKKMVRFFIIGLCVAYIAMLSKSSKVTTYFYISDDPIDIIEPEGTKPDIFI